ncbi:MAG: hypothetical protein M0Z31_00635 [Clostridia bacterium]|nr:hypothetical protein [Clostridia bacterium]
MIRWLERQFTCHAPVDDFLVSEKAAGLADGSTIVIVGGGLAGSAFARQMLMLCHKEKKRYQIYLINSTGCNYCGGLVTDLALQTLNTLYGQGIAEDVVLKKVQTCVYINSEGSFKIRIGIPMMATLRTSRFGFIGMDDSLKTRILEGLDEEVWPYLKIVEPTLVNKLTPPQETGNGCWRVTTSIIMEDGQHQAIDCDLLVLATGFRSLNRPMLKEFSQVTGYVPPPVMESSVTEIDTGSARFNNIGKDMCIIDGVIPGAVIALIPKGSGWLTLTSLGKKLTKGDLEQLFRHPVFKQHLDLDDVGEHLRCHTICPAAIFTGEADNFYGDGWVMLGDLTGYGRVLKDGYFGSFLGAYLAAHTAVYRGIMREDWRVHYHRPLRGFEIGNRVGMLLFNFNQKLNGISWFNRFFMAAAQSEGGRDNWGGPIHAAVRGITTGTIPYLLIGVFFICGLLRHLVFHPIKTWQHIRKPT